MQRVFTRFGIDDSSHPKKWGFLGGIWSELVQSRSLAWQFFVRDTAARYRQSLLGLAWALMFPLLSIAILLLLSGAGIIRVVDLEVPYPVYIVIGIWFWGLFALTLTACTSSLVEAGPIITKISFSRPAVIMAAAGVGLTEFVIRFPVVLLVIAYYAESCSVWRLVLAAASLAPLFVLAVALGLFFSVGAALVRHVAFAMPVVINGLMLLTPVLYPLAPGSALERVNRLNPVAHFISFSRSLLLGAAVDLTPYWICTALTVVLFLAGWRFFHVAQKRIAERV